ncbi:hypothetical protein ACSSS7_006025 [Eimeria intestinalis]
MAVAVLGFMCFCADGYYFPYEDGKRRSRGQKIVQIRQRKDIFGLGSAARLVMCDAGRSLLVATAYRMREEVLTFGDCLAKDRVALLRGLDHLEAPLLLIERLLAPFLAPGMGRVDLAFVNAACRHYHLAIDAFLAVAPAFRKAQAVRHRWIRNRGKLCATIRCCCSIICCGCHCHKHPPMARRMARARRIFEDLEYKHEACVIDLALTYEYYLSSPEPPPPDAPARCLAAGTFILAAQRKLHQVCAARGSRFYVRINRANDVGANDSMLVAREPPDFGRNEVPIFS